MIELCRHIHSDFLASNAISHARSHCVKSARQLTPVAVVFWRTAAFGPQAIFVKPSVVWRPFILHDIRRDRGFGAHDGRLLSPKIAVVLFASRAQTGFSALRHLFDVGDERSSKKHAALDVFRQVHLFAFGISFILAILSRDQILRNQSIFRQNPAL